MMEYYHADRLNYAVAGTPNRLEYDQGFFVKQGDGAADIKPIAHLYKTQVYALAEYLGVPEEIRRRPPTTDTFSLPQTQEEFYFALPYDEDGPLPLRRTTTACPPAEVAAGDRPDRRAGRARLPATSTRSAARRATCTRGRCWSTPVTGGRRLMCGIAGVDASARGRCRRPTLRAARGDGRRAPPPRPRRVRPLPRSPRRPRARAAVDHRPRHRPAAARERARHAVDRLQRRDLQLRRAARRARRARPPVPDPQRHRGHRPRLRGVGRRTRSARFNGQWAVGAVGRRAPRAGAGARSVRRAAALRRRARRPPVRSPAR